MSTTEQTAIETQLRNHPNQRALIERLRAQGEFVPCDCRKCRQPRLSK